MTRLRPQWPGAEGAPSVPVQLGAVALGGAIGALLRWGLGTALPDPGSQVPWTTLGINVLGSFLLALLPASRSVAAHPLLPLLLGTGVLGGFTTLSTYSDQARSLLAAGRPALAAAYVVGTLALCLLAVAAASRLVARRRILEVEGGDR